ncbi:hypothetical protein TIFTF001_005635 [Ficus carica]|uniref:Leucine zipper homeobox-associated domain-containing protein n=1 Tax=Ficus carica TaxID=3494 RepID=A0AA88CV42_FICCA|nr:hypothetical protein TIFTF001_005635 [Ficus carica]
MMVVGWAVGAHGLGGSHWIYVDCSYARVGWTARGWWIVVGVRKLYGGRGVVGSWRHLGWRGEGAAWGVCVMMWDSLRGELARWRSFGLENNLHYKSSDLHQENKKKLLCLRYDHLLPSDLKLGPSDEAYQPSDHQASSRVLSAATHENMSSELKRASSDLTSFSNSSTTVKRDRDVVQEVETDQRVVCSRVSTDLEDEEAGSPRKKLRLTKQQSALLEDSFKEHTTLNPLKQTEADYERLKKCCETLTEENSRLQKELQELKSLKLTAPLFMQFQTSTTLTICPSCERICSGGGGGGGDGPSTSPFLIGPKPHFSNPFTTHPSAAC